MFLLTSAVITQRQLFRLNSDWRLRDQSDNFEALASSLIFYAKGFRAWKRHQHMARFEPRSEGEENLWSKCFPPWASRPRLNKTLLINKKMSSCLWKQDFRPWFLGDWWILYNLCFYRKQACLGTFSKGKKIPNYHNFCWYLQIYSRIYNIGVWDNKK